MGPILKFAMVFIYPMGPIRYAAMEVGWGWGADPSGPVTGSAGCVVNLVSLRPPLAKVPQSPSQVVQVVVLVRC